MNANLVELFPLTEQEIVDRDHHIQVVHNVIGGIHHLSKIGDASLKQLRDRRLYRATHKTWEVFVNETFGISGNYAHKQIVFGEILENLNVYHGTHLPTNERQVRPLSKLSPDEQVTAWQNVIDSATKDENGNPQITAKLVSEEVEKLKKQLENEKKESEKWYGFAIASQKSEAELKKKHDQLAMELKQQKPTIIEKIPDDYHELQTKVIESQEKIKELKTKQDEDVSRRVRCELLKQQDIIDRKESERISLERMIADHNNRLSKISEYDSELAHSQRVNEAASRLVTEVGGFIASVGGIYEFTTLHDRAKDEIDNLQFHLKEAMTVCQYFLSLPSIKNERTI